MSATPPNPPATLPLSLARRMDEVCGQFEAAWKAASSPEQRPQIEDYLADMPEPWLSDLLRELILVDIFHRRRSAADPQPADYQARFPALDLAWLARAVAARPAGEPGPAPASEKPATDEPADGELTATSRGKRIRCPHCHNPIQLGDKQPDEVLCPACGSSFRLRDARQTATVKEMRPLGKYQLLERVGLGAFGAVWRARDTELNRIVALKIPHSGLLTEGAELERFHREARAAAQLRHPGIVSVYEVATLNGLPVIVSEFVHGVPLKDVLELRRLTFREAATLVAEVAEALDYAHRQGLVHRDIKPANIMLESRSSSSVANEQTPATADDRRRTTDDGLKPLILDFGLALREEAEITITMDGQIIGTPAYMSPEQAQGKGHEADARSDIYSLGVVLYELLCGELPFRGSRVMMLQQVLHEEPRPPRRFNGKIPRDLETICLKALAKEPSRRYATAQALADDMRRFLNGEPIVARPVGRAERAWRWCRRKPLAATLLGVVLLLIVDMSLVMTIALIYMRASFSLASARSRSAELARSYAETQQQRAKANLRRARDAVDAMLTEVSESRKWLADTPQMDEMRRELLKKALTFHKEFLVEDDSDPLLRQEAGQNQWSLARIYHLLGDHEQANKAFLEAIDIFKKLVDDFSSEPGHRQNLGVCHDKLGLLLQETGRIPEAKAAFHRAVEIQEKLVAEFPTRPGFQQDLAYTFTNLAILLQNTPQMEEAQEAYRKALKIREKLVADFPKEEAYLQALSHSYNNLGTLLVDTNRIAEADEPYGKALKIRKQLVADFPTVPDYRHELAKLHSNMGRRLNRIGQLPEAEESLREALRLHEKLVADFPARPYYRFTLVGNYINLANVLSEAGKPQEANNSHRQAVELNTKLVAEFPNVPDYQSQMGTVLHSQAYDLSSAGERGMACQLLHQAIDHQRSALARNPGTGSCYVHIIIIWSGSSSRWGSMPKRPKQRRSWPGRSLMAGKTVIVPLSCWPSVCQRRQRIPSFRKRNAKSWHKAMRRARWRCFGKPARKDIRTSRS